MKDKTFAIIKPDAVKNGYTGKIYDRILKSDFSIIGAKLLQMTQDQAEGFYEVHSRRSWRHAFSGALPHILLALMFALHVWTEPVFRIVRAQGVEHDVKALINHRPVRQDKHGNRALR